jgi:hypothetical protein
MAGHEFKHLVLCSTYPAALLFDIASVRVLGNYMQICLGQLRHFQRRLCRTWTADLPSRRFWPSMLLTPS